MPGRIRTTLRRSAFRFGRASDGSIMPLMALSLIPIMGLIGAAVDYSRAATVRTKLQANLDSAVLAGAKDGTANWPQVALAVFNGSFGTPYDVTASPSFTSGANGTYSATATASVPTSVLAMVSISAVDVSATSVATPPNDPDNACILTLDSGKALSDVSMNFGGAPNIALAGCSVRTNTSLNCNGHSGGAIASIAAGTAVGCSNPKSWARVVPDIYAALSSNITRLCGGSTGGVAWNVSLAKVPSGVQTVSKTGYTEYHICGDLTLSGSGSLLGDAPSSDSAIIIENGALNLSNNASVSTARTVIVMTGNTTAASAINFPNGNGQSASLSLSPPRDTADPWRGVSLYQDPNQTADVIDKWGPGATFIADGVVYLPHADLTMSGIAASNNYRCSKIVTNTFATNGSVSLSFAQASDGCTTIGMNQWSDVPLHLAQ